MDAENEAVLPVRPRQMVAKLVRRGEDGEMDREFWRKAGAEGRFSAAWEMVGEVNAIRGGDRTVARLRRDVARLVRLEEADSPPTEMGLPPGK